MEIWYVTRYIERGRKVQMGNLWSHIPDCVLGYRAAATLGHPFPILYFFPLLLRGRGLEGRKETQNTLDTVRSPSHMRAAGLGKKEGRGG